MIEAVAFAMVFGGFASAFGPEVGIGVVGVVVLLMPAQAGNDRRRIVHALEEISRALRKAPPDGD